MIRRLHEDDRAALEILLRSAPEHNLYALGNLRALGTEAPFCTFHGDLDASGHLRGMTNRYFNGWTVYGEPGADWAGLASTIDAHGASETLQDNPGGVPSIMPWISAFRGGEEEVEELMRLDEDALRPLAPPAGVRIRRATLEDLPALISLYADAGRMSRSPAGVERPLRDTRVFIAERAAPEAGEPILSAALTNAETAENAMIGGVFTPEHLRGRGLSQAVCSALCADLQASGLTPVLYWKSPAAGAIYRKLGFRPIGHWRVVTLTPLSPT
jgi:RimJ/RimL family protein N-acetyltransferase